MADYGSFSQGSAVFPITTSGSNSFLQDADPALFYLLEFYASVINTYVAPRFLAEVTSAGISGRITAAVAETLPLDPQAYLTDSHVRFPLLAACRRRSNYKFYGQKKNSVDEYEVSYVLPAMSAGEAERLLPMLRAVAGIVDNRTEMGMDPSYAPTGASAGALVWPIAGVSIARVKSVEYAGYAPTDALFFPAVMLHVELLEIFDMPDSQLQPFNGVDVAIGLADPTAVTLPDVVDVAIDLTSP